MTEPRARAARRAAPRAVSPPALTELREGLARLQPLEAAESVARPGPALARTLASLGIDRARLIIDLYEARGLADADRKAGGVYYTPSWIIEAMLDRLPSAGEWLDPAAGAGAFLVALARRLGPSGLARVSACDVDPQALDAAAFALEAALGAASREAVATWRRTRAHTLDFLREPLPGRAPDVIVGNPPYGLGGGDDLPRLFPDLRGEIDLYACFLARATRVVQPRGVVALLVPDSWLTNRGARPLRGVLAGHGLSRIIDFGKPFSTAKDTRVHAVFAAQSANVCTVERQREDSLTGLEPATRSDLLREVERGWFLYRTHEEAEACRVMERAPRLADSFDVLYGLRTGDNQRHVIPGDGAIRLVAGRDLDAYDRHLTPRHLGERAPFETVLRRQLGRWKLGIQRIRTNSVQPWRRWVEAAPLEPGEVGLDSLTLVAEAPGVAKSRPSDGLLHVLGVLNSSILNRWYRLTFTDVNIKPLYVGDLPLPPFDARVAALVKRRLERPGNIPLERAIDRLVAAGYGLTEPQVDCLERGFWAEDGQPMPTLSEAIALAG